MFPLHQTTNCWLRKIRTFISAFVAQCSLPLNYKPIFADARLRFELGISDSNSDVLPLTPPGILCSMSESNTLLRFGRPARIHQRLYCIVGLIGFEPIHNSFWDYRLFRWATSQFCFAVRMRIPAWMISVGQGTHNNRSTICDVTITRTNRNPYESWTHIFTSKEWRPQPLDERAILWTARESNPAQ